MFQTLQPYLFCFVEDCLLLIKPKGLHTKKGIVHDQTILTEELKTTTTTIMTNKQQAKNIWRVVSQFTNPRCPTDT